MALRRLCRLAQVSRAGFYRWQKPLAKPADADVEVRDAIQRIAMEFPCSSSRRMRFELWRRVIVGVAANQSMLVHIITRCGQIPSSAAISLTVSMPAGAQTGGAEQCAIDAETKLVPSFKCGKHDL